MKQNHERGFALVEALIIALVLVVVVFAGWWMWQKQQDKKTNTASTAQTSEKNTGATEEKSTGQSPAVTYLTIKEWGVKIGFPDANKVSYTLTQEMTYDTGTKGTEALFKLKESAAKYCRDLGIGLARYDREDGDPQGRDTTKIGDMYYAMTGAPGGCDDDPQGENGADFKLRSAVIGSTFDIKAAQ